MKAERYRRVVCKIDDILEPSHMNRIVAFIGRMRFRSLLLPAMCVLGVCAGGYYIGYCVAGKFFRMSVEDMLNLPDFLFKVSISGYPILEEDPSLLDKYFRPIFVGWMVVVPALVAVASLHGRVCLARYVRSMIIWGAIGYVGMTVVIASALAGRVFFLEFPSSRVSPEEKRQLEVWYSMLMVKTAFLYGLGIVIVAVSGGIAGLLPRQNQK